MKTTKELLELLLFTANEKANGATKLMYQQTKKTKVLFGMVNTWLLMKYIHCY